LEQTFVLERKLEIANRQKNKKKDKINNKQMSLMLQKCAKKKFEKDARFVTKFVDLAVRV